MVGKECRQCFRKQLLASINSSFLVAVLLKHAGGFNLAETVAAKVKTAIQPEKKSAPKKAEPVVAKAKTESQPEKKPAPKKAEPVVDQAGSVSQPAKKAVPRRRPTHILYQHMAYPLTSRPLAVGTDKTAAGSFICIGKRQTGIDGKHCAIVLEDGEAVLINYSPDGTLVDDRLVSDRTVLGLGQTILERFWGREMHFLSFLFYVPVTVLVHFSCLFYSS